MEPFELISNSSNVKLALWSKDFDPSDPKFLFELCCSSLLYDYKNLPKRNIRTGEIVELTIKFEEELKRFYLKYQGEEIYNDIKRIVLTNDDEKGRITFRLCASQFVWRLNKCKQDTKLTSSNKLKKYPILIPPAGFENPIKILAERTNIPYSAFNFFERTKLLFLLKQSIEEYITTLKTWHFADQSFLDFFPAYYVVDEDNLKKINTEKFDRSEPERILYFFSDQSVLLDFITKRNHNNYFFIISDNFNRFFNHSTFQYLYQTLTDNVEKIKVIFFGGISDFKMLNNEFDLPITKVFRPHLLTDGSSDYNKLKENIEVVGNNSANTMINDFLVIAKKYKDINPSFSGNLRKIIYSLCSLDKYNYDVFQKNIKSFLNEYGTYIERDKLNELLRIVTDNNFKNIKTEWNEFLVTDFINEQNHANVVGKKEFKSKVLDGNNDKKFIITFIDSFFFTNFLFPALLLGYINSNQIKFRLYDLERKILLYTFNNFNRKYLNLFGNDFLSEAIKEEKAEPILEDHFNLFEFDLSVISGYHQYGTSEETIKAMTVLSEDDNQEYVSFFTKNYSPTIIDNEIVFDIDLNELEVGHELIMLPGVRNVFQKFSEIFESKQLNVELKNKWKDALFNFLQNHKFSSLSHQLNRLGLNRKEATIRNWINNSSVIGTLHPKEDFLIIAKATNDQFLLNNYSEVADVCITLQRMSKLIGKQIKKLSKAVLRGESIDNLLTEYDITVRNQITNVVKNINVVTVTNILSDFREVDHSMVNQLLEKDKIWV